MGYDRITVLCSGAGWYIGRMHINEEYGFEEPGTRESGYYPTQEDAIQAVVDGFTLRVCSENQYAWEKQHIDTRPGSFYQDKDFWREFANVPGVDLSRFQK